MKFPLVVLDFEASSLEMTSYPIEVGIAAAFAQDEPIYVWSTLIRPNRDWQVHGDWDPAAERVHRIPAASLADGLPAAEVAGVLNRIIGPVGYAYCDGGRYDGFWLSRLFKAARAAQAFQLWDIARLFLLDRGRFHRFAGFLGETEAPHRAGADAARLLSALLLCKGASGRPQVISATPEELVRMVAQNH